VDDAQLSRYPHFSWLSICDRFGSQSRSHHLRCKMVNHWLSCSLHKSATFSVIRNGGERRFVATENTIRFAPSDASQQVVIRHGEPNHAFAVFLIPDNHVRHLVEQEGIKKGHCLAEWISSTSFDISSYVQYLAKATLSNESPIRDESDEIARRLILRLVELSGGGKPDWHDDASVFDRRTLLNLVAYVDEHLRIAPSLSEMSVLAGMSPSHFARKFRQSTGLSLSRFVNRRRILRSLETLKTDASLVSIALDLGFSSQSHFTRLFSGLTGMTPAKYRKSVKPTLG
jgi:AraC-like DNA-binding protein